MDLCVFIKVMHTKCLSYQEIRNINTILCNKKSSLCQQFITFFSLYKSFSRSVFTCKRKCYLGLHQCSQCKFSTCKLSGIHTDTRFLYAHIMVRFMVWPCLSVRTFFLSGSYLFYLMRIS